MVGEAQLHADRETDRARHVENGRAGGGRGGRGDAGDDGLVDAVAEEVEVREGEVLGHARGQLVELGLGVDHDVVADVEQALEPAAAQFGRHIDPVQLDAVESAPCIGHGRVDRRIGVKTQ